MGYRRQPWTERLRVLVEAGPISVNEAVSQMADLVPPGRAYRDSERVVQWVRDKNGYKSMRITSDEEAVKDLRIRGGQKRIVRSALWTQKKHGRVEEYTLKGVRMLRKGPNAWPARPEASGGES
jgi:hypothetical protein